MATGKKSRTRKPSSKWKWTTDQEKAFQILKEKLTSPPILGYPDFSQPFELHSDARGTGLGAVLYPNQDEQNRVIAYASRGLSRSGKKYPTQKLEFLALKWAITEKYSDYLMGQTFAIYTDNKPLTYILISAKLDATSHQWIAVLSAYHFTITYKLGKTNAYADGLSRLPGTLDVDSVKAICDLDQGHPLIETLPVQSLQQIQTEYDPLSRADVRKLQHQDPLISSWFNHVQRGIRPKMDSLSCDFEKPLYKSFKRS